MSPTLTMDNMSDISIGNPIFSSKTTKGDVGLFGVTLANFKHLFIGKFRRTLSFTTQRIVSFPFSLSTLVNHIINIILVSPKKQVVWSDTISYVAMMKYKQSVRDGAIGNLIGKPMDSNILPMRFYLTISMTVYDTGPKPAGISLNSFGPKGKSRVFRQGFIQTNSTTKFSGRPGFFSSETDAAKGASFRLMRISNRNRINLTGTFVAANSSVVFQATKNRITNWANFGIIHGTDLPKRFVIPQAVTSSAGEFSCLNLPQLYHKDGLNAINSQ